MVMHNQHCRDWGGKLASRAERRPRLGHEFGTMLVSESPGPGSRDPDRPREAQGPRSALDLAITLAFTLAYELGQCQKPKGSQCCSSKLDSGEQGSTRWGPFGAS